MPRDTRSCRGSGTAMVIGLRLLYRGFGRLRRGGRVRSKAPHSKCGNPQGFGGSNPFLSATICYQFATSGFLRGPS